MSPNSDSEPTELLRAWSQGDGSALARLMPLVYNELHRLARRYMRQERPDHTLQATSLVSTTSLRSAMRSADWRPFDARMSQVVELRFFGGLTVDETAHVLNVSPETVNRDWKTAKAWLVREVKRRLSTAST